MYLLSFLTDIIADIGSGFGEEITDSSSLSIITTETVGDSIAHVFSKLVIENVELLDEGLYSCLVSNKVGDATEHVGQLIVEGINNTLFLLILLFFLIIIIIVYISI